MNKIHRCCERVDAWMYDENVQKIKIKLENIWIDLIKSIYAPYSLSVAMGLLCITKSVLELINLHMQIADLPLYVFIRINFDGVYECGPGTLYCILNVRMQQVDFPEALSPKQMVDVLVTTSTPISMVDGDIIVATIGLK